MERRKLESAALFLTIAGCILIMPPLAVVFQVQHRVLGIPSEVIYLFIVWAGLVAGSWWLARRLPGQPGVKPPEDER